MEDRLLDSEEWLLESQRLAQLGHYVYDVEADSWTSSEILDQVLGIGPGYVRDFTGWLDIVHSDDRERMSDYFFNEVVGGARPFDTEYRIKRIEDGAVRWVHGLGRLVCDPGGRPTTLFGTIQDVSDRKAREDQVVQLNDQPEERLHQLEAEHRRLRTVLDILPVAVGITDAHGRVLELNDMVKQLWAGSAPPQPEAPLEYGVYKGWWADTGEPLAPEDWTLAQVLRTGEPRLGDIIEIERFDGCRAVINSSAMPMKDENGELVGAVGISDDITEEHRRAVLGGALNEIGVLVYSAPTFDEVLRRGLAKAARALEAESAAASLLGDGQKWVVHTVYCLPGEAVGTVMGDAEEPHAALAISTGDIVAIEDTRNDSRVNATHMSEWGVGAVIAVPLMIRGVPLGVVFFNWESVPRRFSEGELSFARQFGLTVSLALENARLYQALLARAGSAG